MKTRRIVLWFVAAFAGATCGRADGQACVTQQQKHLREATPEAGGSLGWSISVDGGLAVMGAPGRRDLVEAAVFQFTAGAWQEIAGLAPNGAVGIDDFGTSVSLGPGLVVIGAPFDDNDDSNRGAAYIFQAGQGDWQQDAKITAADPTLWFGWSASVSHETVVVGAPQRDTGAVYVFREVTGTWHQVARLVGADAELGDQFGWSVSIDGGTVLVGAPSDINAAGLRAGAAYVFQEAGGAWEQVAKLTSVDAAAWDQFGESVNLKDGIAIVGAPGDDHSGRSDNGSAYVFREINGSWQQVAKLTAADSATGDQLGTSVAINDQTALVGATGDDDGGTQSGSAYLFRSAGANWSQVAKLTADDAEAGDIFGYSVALQGETAFVGAPWDDHGSGFREGSVYLFSFQCAPKFSPGDLNCDGVVTVGDIGPFVLALTDVAAYQGLYPDCDITLADLNMDGVVSVGDIGSFVSLLAGA